MKLCQSNLSPDASRCRIQIYAKGIEGIEYLLALDGGGRVVGESAVISEYLEDHFPEPSLRSDDPFTRAQTRLISQFADQYIRGPFSYCSHR